MGARREETPTVLRSEESVETKLLRIAEKARNEYVQTSANYRMRSRVRESRKHGSGRGAGANGCMDEILWHRRETRRKTEKTNLILQHLKKPVYSTRGKFTDKIAAKVCRQNFSNKFSYRA